MRLGRESWNECILGIKFYPHQSKPSTQVFYSLCAYFNASPGTIHTKHSSTRNCEWSRTIKGQQCLRYSLTKKLEEQIFNFIMAIKCNMWKSTKRLIKFRFSGPINFIYLRTHESSEWWSSLVYYISLLLCYCCCWFN